MGCRRGHDLPGSDRGRRDQDRRVVSFKDGTTTLLAAMDFTGAPVRRQRPGHHGGGPARVMRWHPHHPPVRQEHRGSSESTPRDRHGLTASSREPGLGDLACDPVTFQRCDREGPVQGCAVVPAGGQRQRGGRPRVPGLHLRSALELVAVLGGVPFPRSLRGSRAPLAASPGQFPERACFDTTASSSTWTVTDSPTAGRRPR